LKKGQKSCNILIIVVLFYPILLENSKGKSLLTFLKAIPFTIPTTASARFNPSAKEVFPEKKAILLQNYILIVMD